MISSQIIYVAGHRGMVGSAIVHQLQTGQNLAVIITRTHAELDLANQAAVQGFFVQEKPIQVYLAAAKVGGIYAYLNSVNMHEFTIDQIQNYAQSQMELQPC